jgi:hypothetical protein
MFLIIEKDKILTYIKSMGNAFKEYDRLYTECDEDLTEDEIKLLKDLNKRTMEIYKDYENFINSHNMRLEEIRNATKQSELKIKAKEYEKYSKEELIGIIVEGDK